MGTCLSPQREGINHRTARPGSSRNAASSPAPLLAPAARRWLLRKKKFRITNKVVYCRLRHVYHLCPLAPVILLADRVLYFRRWRRRHFGRSSTRLTTPRWANCKLGAGGASRAATLGAGRGAGADGIRGADEPPNSRPAAFVTVCHVLASSRPCLCSVLLSRATMSGRVVVRTAIVRSHHGA